MICFLAELPNVGDQTDGDYGDLAFSRDELLSNANELTVGKQFQINKVTPVKLLTEIFHHMFGVIPIKRSTKQRQSTIIMKKIPMPV